MASGYYLTLGKGDSHEPRGRPDDTLSSSSKPMPAEEVSRITPKIWHSGSCLTLGKDDSHEPRGRSPDATSSSRSRRYSSEPINILNSVNTNSSDNDRLQVQIFLNEIEAMKSAYAELFRIFHGRGPVPVPSGSNRNHDRIFEHADMLVYLAEKFSCFEEYS